MRKVCIAATQMSVTWDRELTLKNAEKLVRGAAEEGANIILLQELFETPYFCQRQDIKYYDLATTVEENRGIKLMKELAKELHVVLPVSFFERYGNTQFNSLVVIDADGMIIDLYRKSHIPDGLPYAEKFYFTPGDTGFKVFNTEFGRIGVAVCWDQWFPEVARALALKGAQMILYPTAIGSELLFEKDSSVHWQNVMRGHAAANIMPVVASNRIGTEKDETEMTFYGSSFISDQHGNIVKSMDKETPGFIVYEFDLDEIDRERREWGVFRDRRPDLYSILTTHGEM